MNYDDIRAAVTERWAETDALRDETNAVFRSVAATQAEAQRLRGDSQARRRARLTQPAPPRWAPGR
jgi:anti-sigma factor RsiW